MSLRESEPLYSDSEDCETQWKEKLEYLVCCLVCLPCFCYLSAKDGLRRSKTSPEAATAQGLATVFTLAVPLIEDRWSPYCAANQKTLEAHNANVAHVSSEADRLEAAVETKAKIARCCHELVDELWKCLQLKYYGFMGIKHGFFPMMHDELSDQAIFMEIQQPDDLLDDDMRSTELSIFWPPIRDVWQQIDMVADQMTMVMNSMITMAPIEGFHWRPWCE